MAKKEAKIKAQVKVQIAGGKATPAPPVGTALGPHGINLGQFVMQFNEKTRDLNGMIVPVVITIFEDRSFTFVLKSPPASVLLKQAAKHVPSWPHTFCWDSGLAFLKPWESGSHKSCKVLGPFACLFICHCIYLLSTLFIFLLILAILMLRAS